MRDFWGSPKRFEDWRLMMKRLKKPPALLAFALLLFLAIPGSSRPASASIGASVSVSGFHGALAPYGTWVTVGNYGRCWRPARVSFGWQPYSNGRWLYTDYGWTWASYDPWGEIPYHYGTWVYDPADGWVWVPGTVWGPAWVTWCSTDDFIGWAPLAPGFVFTTSGYFGRPIVCPTSSYVFVATRSFVGVNAASVRVAPSQNATLLRSGTKTTRFSVANGVVRTSGPDPKRIERVTHRAIRPTSLSRANLRPTRFNAARGSRIALTTRSSATSRPAVSTRAAGERQATAHATAHSNRSTMVRGRVPKVQASPNRVLSHARPSGHPKTLVTSGRRVAPRKQAAPRTRVTTLRSSSGPAPTLTATYPVTAQHGARAVERAPAPVVARERPVVHAAPRVESRPAAAPRIEARHGQPSPRASRKEDGR